MTHKNYFEIEADNTYELGLQKGKLFGESLLQSLNEERKGKVWSEYVRRSREYLTPTEKVFPELVAELKGYAHGAGTSFEELWTLNLLDELTQDVQEKCTTFVTNNGFLVAHNEDWSADAEDELCVLKRTIGDATTLELFYVNTLGGNAISINSHGILQAINSLNHYDHQMGIPKCVVARWLSDTSAPERDLEMLGRLRRASGFHHVIVNSLGNVWSVECSAKSHIITTPAIPFVHTNHYLMPEMAVLEGNSNRFGTFGRLSRASENVSETMSIEKARKILGDSSQGKRRSIHSNRTIGGMIVDVDHMQAMVWLRRESKKGWLSYEMN
ncbi:C45 family autoproteolytic acyltransferase/hydolase [Bythopirellula goksoeyrii]|uniref:Acyl-coenzyme A:6-aminopenicillanic acid acyl-transferase n=1 Tax=Bythopirellula goksoeyrii TaxID=1400387 RepID=A0A5B9Q1U9_9BACT|nr:C45 family peptidase [Bythopirellula goksoeyrii]QEG32948.1 Acyl-coenzyme A:6-aminopenicillanic acid acyl-transferase [Bythopirellula goksoeyrii]